MVVEPRKRKKKVNLLKICVDKQAKSLRKWMESTAGGASASGVASNVLKSFCSDSDYFVNDTLEMSKTLSVTDKNKKDKKAVA